MSHEDPVLTEWNIVALLGTEVLGSRVQGRQLRALLQTQVDAGVPVRLDFTGIELLTSAFADECFGKLWDSVAHPQLRKFIHLKGLSGNNKAVFQFVIRERREPSR